MATLRAEGDEDDVGGVPAASATPPRGSAANPADGSPVQAWASAVAVVAAVASIVASVMRHGGMAALLGAVAVGLALTGYLGARGTGRAGFVSLAAGGVAIVALLLGIISLVMMNNAEVPGAAP